MVVSTTETDLRGVKVMLELEKLMQGEGKGSLRLAYDWKAAPSIFVDSASDWPSGEEFKQAEDEWKRASKSVREGGDASALQAATEILSDFFLKTTWFQTYTRAVENAVVCAAQAGRPSIMAYIKGGGPITCVEQLHLPALCDGSIRPRLKKLMGETYTDKLVILKGYKDVDELMDEVKVLAKFNSVPELPPLDKCWKDVSKGTLVPEGAIEAWNEGKECKNGPLYIGRTHNGEIGKYNSNGGKMHNLWTHHQQRSDKGQVLVCPPEYTYQWKNYHRGLRMADVPGLFQASSYSLDNRLCVGRAKDGEVGKLNIDDHNEHGNDGPYLNNLWCQGCGKQGEGHVLCFFRK